MKELKLVDKIFTYDSAHKDWWKQHQKQEAVIDSIRQKNALILKPVYEKMVKQGVHTIYVPFSGGGDCGGFDGNIEYRNKDEDILTIDYKKLKPDGWRTVFTPYVWENKIDDCKRESYIFEAEKTDYDEYEVTEDWLIQKFYDFGFLNEWGSFAGEFHVNGEVIIYPKTGKYKMPYNQSVEEYTSHESEGSMFDEIKTSTEN